MERRIDVRKIVDVVLDTGDLFGVRKKALHLALCAAVSELQVVEHVVLTFCEALICVDHGLLIRSKFVPVIGHVAHRHVRNGCRLLRVSADRRDQRRGKARHVLHVLVGGHARRFPRFAGVCLYELLRCSKRLEFFGCFVYSQADRIRVLLQRFSARAEERFDAADKLLIACVCFDRLLCKCCRAGCTGCKQCACSFRRVADEFAGRLYCGFRNIQKLLCKFFRLFFGFRIALFVFLQLVVERIELRLAAIDGRLRLVQCVLLLAVFLCRLLRFLGVLAERL